MAGYLLTLLLAAAVVASCAELVEDRNEGSIGAGHNDMIYEPLKATNSLRGASFLESINGRTMRRCSPNFCCPMKLRCCDALYCCDANERRKVQPARPC